MIAYSIKSVLCLLVLWGFYKLALEPLVAHRLKRFYLLFSLLISLALPLFTISYEVEAQPLPVTETFTYSAASDTPTVQMPRKKNTAYLPYIFFSVYGLGVLFFGFRFTRNLGRIHDKIRSSEKMRSTDHIKVLLDQKTVPHSFLRFIFLAKTDFKEHRIAPEILEHERAHVIQRHTWDILLIELLQVFFWFNPLLFWFKKSVALNHEFLADQRAMFLHTDPGQYTHLLFQYSGGAHHTALSSPINYSLTKKRILMLSQTFSAKKLASRLAFLLPVLALCIYFFNQDIVAKPIYSIENANKTNNWVQLYMENDHTLWLEDKKINPENLSEELTQLTGSDTKEQKAKLKLILNLDSEILLKNLSGIIDTIHTYGVKSLVGRGLIPPPIPPKTASKEALKNYSKQLDNYNDILKLPLREQLSSKDYKWNATFTIFGDDMPEQASSSFQKGNKILKIRVIGDQIRVNDKNVNLDEFTDTVNTITANWSEEEKQDFIFDNDYDLKKFDKNFMDKFVKEYKKTDISIYEIRRNDIAKNKKNDTIYLSDPFPVFLDSTSSKKLKEKNYGKINRQGKIKLEVSNEVIKVNDKIVNIDDFADKINEITKKLNQKELTKVKFEESFNYVSIPFMNKMRQEFAKTRMADAQATLNFNHSMSQSALSPNAPEILDPKFQKHLKLKIENKHLTVNGISTTISNFRNTVDQITKDWTTAEIRSFFGIELIKSDSSIDPFLQKIKNEFDKTQLYNSSPYKEILFPDFKKNRTISSPLLIFSIKNEKISFRENKNISLHNFAVALDKLTQNWSIDQLKNTNIKTFRSDTSEKFEQELQEEFSKTKLYQYQGGTYNTTFYDNVTSTIDLENPSKAIDQVERKGGSFFYNNAEISSEKARDLIKDMKKIIFKIGRTSDSDKPKIFIEDRK